MRAPKLKFDDFREKLWRGGEDMAKWVLSELEASSDADAQTWEIRALCYDELRDAENASACALKAHELSGSLMHWAMHAAALLNIESERDRGREILEGMIDAKEAAPPVFASLSRFYWTQGKPQKALNVLEMAININEFVTWHPAFLMMAAYTYSFCGDTDEAKRLTLHAFELIQKKDEILSFSEYTPESVRTIIQSKAFGWPKDSKSLESYISAVAEWTQEQALALTEIEPDEDELYLANDEFVGRYRSAVEIDWSQVTPDMYVTADDFGDELMAFANTIAAQSRE